MWDVINILMEWKWFIKMLIVISLKNKVNIDDGCIC